MITATKDSFGIEKIFGKAETKVMEIFRINVQSKPIMYNCSKILAGRLKQGGLNLLFSMYSVVV